MKKIVLFILLFSQITYGQQIDFISYDKINLLAIFNNVKEEQTILKTDGSKEERLVSIDTVFGMFAYFQERGDSLILFYGKRPKLILEVKKFNWFISKDGSWNLILDTNDSTIKYLFFVIEDKSKWIWQKELKLWEAPVTIFFSFNEKLKPDENAKIILRMKSFTFIGGEFKIPDKVFSTLMKIKQ